MKFRKKPVVIEAVQFDGDNAERIVLWITMKASECQASVNENGLSIETLEGKMHVSKGDWVIRGVKEEFYPCKPDIFLATYEPVHD